MNKQKSTFKTLQKQLMKMGVWEVTVLATLWDLYGFVCMRELILYKPIDNP